MQTLGVLAGFRFPIHFRIISGFAALSWLISAPLPTSRWHYRLQPSHARRRVTFCPKQVALGRGPDVGPDVLDSERRPGAAGKDLGQD
jgi:hypothetical protein